ncbi:MAG: adenylyl-sulfate kinase [Nitrospira sp. LK70]|nr:adenylyl-sulfate kinase [Nitrospira sp. LK70]
MINCYVLDGDNIRHGLTRDLGFGTLRKTFAPDVPLETDVKTLDEGLSISRRMGMWALLSAAPRTGVSLRFRYVNRSH